MLPHIATQTICNVELDRVRLFAAVSRRFPQVARAVPCARRSRPASRTANPPPADRQEILAPCPAIPLDNAALPAYLPTMIANPVSWSPSPCPNLRLEPTEPEVPARPPGGPALLPIHPARPRGRPTPRPPRAVVPALLSRPLDRPPRSHPRAKPRVRPAANSTIRSTFTTFIFLYFPTTATARRASKASRSMRIPCRKIGLHGLKLAFL
jgi:hypothetical protein